MLPLVRLAADSREHTVAEAMQQIARDMRISEVDRDALLPSGTQTRFYNRITWAITYLTKSLLLERPGKGRFKITPRGLTVAQSNPPQLNNAFLERFPEYKAFKAKKNQRPIAKGSAADAVLDPDADITPDERLDAAFKELQETLADDLLERVRASTPKFFEHLVVDLLRAMGYGGPRDSDARVVGRSGDGGIDGVIQEDRLGLDMVYVQAKKWENPVGPDEIRKFVGSLGEQKAHKGVFITSGTFTAGARTAAERANAKVVLIDGDQLADLMIDHGVGVADHKAYMVRKLDGDYFESL
jgi:restriction system protein